MNKIIYFIACILLCNIVVAIVSVEVNPKQPAFKNRDETITGDWVFTGDITMEDVNIINKSVLNVNDTIKINGTDINDIFYKLDTSNNPLTGDVEMLLDNPEIRMIDDGGLYQAKISCVSDCQGIQFNTGLSGGTTIATLGLGGSFFGLVFASNVNGILLPTESTQLLFGGTSYDERIYYINNAGGDPSDDEIHVDADNIELNAESLILNLTSDSQYGEVEINTGPEGILDINSPNTQISGDLTVNDDLFTHNIYPTTTSTYDIGSVSKKYNDLHLADDIFMGDTIYRRSSINAYDIIGNGGSFAQYFVDLNTTSTGIINFQKQGVVNYQMVLTNSHVHISEVCDIIFNSRGGGISFSSLSSAGNITFQGSNTYVNFFTPASYALAINSVQPIVLGAYNGFPKKFWPKFSINLDDYLNNYQATNYTILNSSQAKVLKIEQNGDTTHFGDENVTGNFTGNQIYGEMWNRTASGDPFTVTIGTIGVYYNVTNLLSSKNNGFSFTDETQANGGSYLTAHVSGRYLASASISSIIGTASGDIYGYAISHEFERSNHNNCYARRTAVNSLGNIGITCLIDIEAGTRVNIQVEQETGAIARNIRISTINLNLVRVGDIP